MDIKRKNGKIYCIGCDKYRKSLIPEISYIFDKTLFISIICSKCGDKKNCDNNDNDK